MNSYLSTQRLTVAIGGLLALVSLLFSLIVVPVAGGFTAADLGAEFTLLILGCGVAAMFVAVRGDRLSRLVRADSGVLVGSAVAGGAALVLIYTRMRDTRFDSGAGSEIARAVEEVAQSAGWAPSYGLGTWTLALAVVVLGYSAYLCRSSAVGGRPVGSGSSRHEFGSSPDYRPQSRPPVDKPTDWL